MMNNDTYNGRAFTEREFSVSISPLTSSISHMSRPTSTVTFHDMLELAGNYALISAGPLKIDIFILDDDKVKETRAKNKGYVLKIVNKGSVKSAYLTLPALILNKLQNAITLKKHSLTRIVDGVITIYFPESGGDDLFDDNGINHMGSLGKLPDDVLNTSKSIEILNKDKMSSTHDGNQAPRIGGRHPRFCKSELESPILELVTSNELNNAIELRPVKVTNDNFELLKKQVDWESFDDDYRSLLFSDLVEGKFVFKDGIIGRIVEL